MIALGGLVWLAVQYISQSGWSASLLRIPQAVSSFLPYGGVIMLFIIITGALHWHHTFHWMESGIMDPNSDNYDHIIAGKEAYLNIPFFLSRAIIYLILRLKA